jgi:hypothetical protein
MTLSTIGALQKACEMVNYNYETPHPDELCEHLCYGSNPYPPVHKPHLP